MSGDPETRASRLTLERALRVLPWVVLVAFAVVLARTAWLSDDSYISFRTIRNFVHGDGLRWNLAARVQVFTHPLWVLLLSALSAITGELYYTTLFASMVISLVTAWLMAFRVAPTRMAGFVCAVVLLCSRSFVDFSTSGLENPLTHLLLAGFALVFVSTERWTPRRLWWLSLLAGVAATNRMDTVLLVVPPLAWAWWQERSRRGLLMVVAGFAPLVLWEIFSVVYYGFPFPNTAYAKIPGEIGIGSRLVKGGGYLFSSILMDPLSMLVIGIGLVAPAIRKRWELVPLSVGIALYTIYIVWVGGDFMGGRFFTAALVLALAAAMRLFPLPATRRWLIPAGVALGLSAILGPHCPLITDSRYGTRWHWTKNIDSRGVADERAVYYKITGLLRARSPFTRPWHAWFEQGSHVPPGGVARAATVGFFGWAAPRDAFIVDQLGLGDAFIARLPPKSTTHWRPGHLDRDIPNGYLATRRTGTMQLTNHWLADYYQQMHLITSGPIWSGARWKAIWRLNTGQLNDLLTHAHDVELPAARLARPRPDGTRWNTLGAAIIGASGALYVDLGAPIAAARVHIACDGNDTYRLTLARGDHEVWSTDVGPANKPPPGLHNHTVDVPPTAGEVDTVIVHPSGGDDRYSVGYLAVEPR